MKALVFGSLNIDYFYGVDHFVQKGETISSTSLEVYSGGKGLNQATALAKAGANVYQAGCIGKDGLFLLDELRAAKVKTELIAVLDDVRSGNAIIQNDKEGDNCILLYGGANRSITKAYVDDVLALFDPGDVILLQNEINEMAYIVEKAKEKGLVLILNPSPLDEDVLNLPLEYFDYFILNEIEASQILENDQEMEAEALLDSLTQKFPKAKLVLTVGSKGSYYADETTRFFQKAYKVNAVDTTAAGDTFTGYFIASLMAGKNVTQAMNIAAKASSITVQSKGAAPSIPVIETVLEEM
ncbi:ribokinase [Lachnospiraceae bacterium PF1-21]